MSNRPLRSCAAIGAIAAALVVFALAPAPAVAIGYFNMPGNFCQCFGYGCGPGYHAPLVLGPVSCHGWCAHNVERLPYAPCPPCNYAGSGCGCAIGEPSLLEPSFMPSTAPTPEPAPAPTLAPAAYRVPFRY